MCVGRVRVRACQRGVFLCRRTGKGVQAASRAAPPPPQPLASLHTPPPASHSTLTPARPAKPLLPPDPHLQGLPAAARVRRVVRVPGEGPRERRRAVAAGRREGPRHDQGRVAADAGERLCLAAAAAGERLGGGEGELEGRAKTCCLVVSALLASRRRPSKAAITQTRLILTSSLCLLPRFFRPPPFPLPPSAAHTRARPQAPGSAFDAAVQGRAFVYDYINPAYPTVAPSIREMCPACDPEKVRGDASPDGAVI